MQSFLNEIISENQHGFRKGFSCTTQLLHTYHDINKHVDNGMCIQAVALVFAKAFDKVSHDLLMKKLCYYKIPKIFVKRL